MLLICSKFTTKPPAEVVFSRDPRAEFLHYHYCANYAKSKEFYDCHDGIREPTHSSQLITQRPASFRSAVSKPLVNQP